jgi:hypothetical protein
VAFWQPICKVSYWPISAYCEDRSCPKPAPPSKSVRKKSRPVMGGKEQT